MYTVHILQRQYSVVSEHRGSEKVERRWDELDVTASPIMKKKHLESRQMTFKARNETDKCRRESGSWEKRTMQAV